MATEIITNSPLDAIETEELIQKLRDSGYDELIDTLIDHEDECYTKKARLNKSATTRKLGWKSKQLEESLEEMREILRSDFGLEEDPEDPEGQEE